MERKTYCGPMRLAHRGLAQSAPENTLGAFQGAVDHGFEGMEIDIQLSKDGEIIVAHDSNFTRMTLGHPTGFTNARLCELTWDEIRKIELPYANHTLPRELPHDSGVEDMAIMPSRVMGQEGGSDYETALTLDSRTTHLMRFYDFDQWLATQAGEITVEVEVKAAGMMPRMKEILKDSPNVSRYIIFSGVPAYVQEIQEAFRENKPEGLRLGANIRFLTEEQKRFVEQSDLFEVGLNAGAFTDDDVQWLAEHGVHVFANLGDTPEQWEVLCSKDVMAFKTNYAQAFTDWWMEVQHG